MKLTDITSVVIASHVFAYGTSQGFYDYCRRKGWQVKFIGHPLFGNVFTWLLGTIDTVWQVLRTGKRYDLFVGSNSLNAFVGLFLRVLGRVDKVIYFSPDWVAERFSNPLLNRVYHLLDYVCVKYTDMTWNSSAIMPKDPMMREREKLGYGQALQNKQIQVSDGTENIQLPDFSRIERWKIGFIGHLRPGMGVEMLLEALPLILKKHPKVTLTIMGSGPLEAEFRQQARNLPVEFTGFMGDINQVYKILSYCAIAVAPYEAGSISIYTDPGKVKSYLTAGLPIVITKVPIVASKIAKKKAGIAVPDNVAKFAAAVSTLLASTQTLKKYRQNALLLRNEYSWDRVFDRALQLL